MRALAEDVLRCGYKLKAIITISSTISLTIESLCIKRDLRIKILYSHLEIPIPSYTCL